MSLHVYTFVGEGVALPSVVVIVAPTVSLALARAVTWYLAHDLNSESIKLKESQVLAIESSVDGSTVIYGWNGDY